MTYDPYILDSTQRIGQEILDGRVSAHKKHGDNSIENNSSADSVFWLGCLGEEMGEVFSTFTYDKDSNNLRAELIDVITVATAWIAAIDRDE